MSLLQSPFCPLKPPPTFQAVIFYGLCGILVHVISCWAERVGQKPRFLSERPARPAEQHGLDAFHGPHSRDCAKSILDHVQNPSLKCAFVTWLWRSEEASAAKLRHSVHSAAPFASCKCSRPFRLPAFCSSAPQGYFITVYHGDCVYFHLGTIS